ncbi:ABC transporter substrate-binding protein [Paenarthrobacter sp. C1]|uniref:ABC transporter substrate-binding protein n=1 Tax=Paenarthrobacter sp. C1 TaxID=3400220 RepID=UPI003BF4B751
MNLKFNLRTGPAKVVFVTTISASLFLTGCGGGSVGNKDDAEADNGFCSKGSITIGSAKALSGGFAFYDTAGSHAEQLAVDQVNAEGGINGCQVKLVTQDTKSDPAIGRQVARELIRGGAEILVPPANEGLGTPAALTAQGEGIFSIAGASGDDYAPGVGALFATGGSMSSLNGETAAVFAKDQGYDSVYYATNEAYPYFKTVEKTFRQGTGQKELGRSALTAGQTDFSAVVSDIKRSISAGSNPVILLATMYPDAPTMITQLRKAGVTTPVIGNATWATRNLTDALGGNTQGVFYSSGAYTEGEDASDKARKFVQDYKQKTGAFPENHQAQETYWTMWALFDAIKSAKSVEGQAVEKALLSQENLELPMRTVNSWKDRHILGTNVVVGFTPEGEFMQVKTYNLTGGK